MHGMVPIDGVYNALFEAWWWLQGGRTAPGSPQKVRGGPTVARKPRFRALFLILMGARRVTWIGGA